MKQDGQTAERRTDLELVGVGDIRCEYKRNPVGIDIANPRLGWKLFGSRRGVMQTAYRIQTAEEDPGFGRLVWDSGWAESGRSQQVEYAGEPLRSCTRYHVRVMIRDEAGRESEWSEPAFWETGLLEAGEWTGDFIGCEAEGDGSQAEPVPLFRKTFQVSGAVERATVYVTALGLYELRLNGSKVGGDLLTPGWTSYTNRLQYQTYDITAQLREGDNAAGALVGEGWYRGSFSWDHQRSIYGNRSALLAEIRIRYRDGREERIATDESWKRSQSEIVASEMYAGEQTDARLLQPGWDLPGFDDSGWKPAERIEADKRRLVAQVNEPVRVQELLRPVELLRTPAGDTVLDMGQNMVGFIRVRAKGPAGAEIVLEHAEVLDKDGNFYADNLRGAKQRNRYVLRGEGDETFEPRFSFQGFRYVRVAAYPGEVKPECFEGVVIHSDMEQSGRFECSEPLVNRLQMNILWGQKGNFVDVPTDCPQRDERMGWTGDAQVFARTACFNMNTASFFTKWLLDMKAEQMENGAIPNYIPHVLPKPRAMAAWGDAVTIVPWALYECYGDTRILAEMYDSMVRWVEYMRSHGEEGADWGKQPQIGDWLALDAKQGSYRGATPEDLVAAAYYVHSTGLVVKTAELLGKEEDAARYRRLHARILDDFRREYVTPNGRIASPTQTAQVLALMFDLLEERDVPRTVTALEELLKKNKNHLTTGFVGTPYICLVLSRFGRTDLAYELLLQQDFPSWLDQVKKGATTIWEHWDGIKEDGSFWSADMNSFNHYAYGSIGDWMYRTVTGINTDPEKPGYKHIHIEPQIDPRLSYAKASYQSLYGAIEAGWSRTDEGMELTVAIPPNTTASVVLPAASRRLLLESGTSVNAAAGIYRTEETADGGIRLEIGSGRYRFTYPAEISEQVPEPTN
ncbi:alpha-L-rhamnosidase [Paenibacillus humicola]|uniref:alpha-L-rhamnosidase n=1 Tax=Paenibacillus humicola TaxID=3110540 RepID=UPI00237A68FE|nr:alpha-L-rhamnosidase [Paenibacillus humicola]